MFKKTLLITFIALLISMSAQANGISLHFSVTVPNIIVIDEDSQQKENSQKIHTTSRSSFAEETIRDGKIVILKTIVTE